MSKLTSDFLEDIYETARILLEDYLKLDLANGCTGGYLTVRNIHNREILFVVKVGEIPDGKRNKYFAFSLEKGERLATKINKGHLTSYQSRDTGYNKYGGAILTSNYILSFSGLPELGDEALMLCLAKELKIIDLIMINMMKYKKFGDDVDKQIKEGYLSGRKNEHFDMLNETIK